MWPHSVTIQNLASMSDAGVPTYGTESDPYRASVQGATVWATSPDGQSTRVSGSRIFIQGAPTVTMGALITHGSTIYEVVGLEPFADGGKPAHVQVYGRLV